MILMLIALALMTPAVETVVTAGGLQGRTIAGTWTLKSEAVSGTLVIEKQGEGLTGRWNGPDGVWQFNGFVDLAKFGFTTDAREITTTESGRTTKGRFRLTFRGENDHDTLRGAFALHRDGEQPDRLQQFTATRQE